MKDEFEKHKYPDHCSKCEFFHETVFEGETESGYGSWEGYCGNYQESGRYETKGRFLGCEAGRFSEEYLKRNDIIECGVCGKKIKYGKRFTNGDVDVCSMACADKFDKSL